MAVRCARAANAKHRHHIVASQRPSPKPESQDSWLYSFQPVLPLPVGNTGNRVIFRPLIPVPLSQPVFKSDTQSFDTVGPDLGDITFDVVYA